MEKLSERLVSWASLIDEVTVEQARTSSRMPFIYLTSAMPDAHLGLGATVGSVIPTLGAIIPPPSASTSRGSDRCPHAVHWADLLEDRRMVREQIERAIPLSAARRTARSWRPPSSCIAELEALAEQKGFDLLYLGNWRNQLGSLGSGNHFIEVSVDEADTVWLFLHSGSRGGQPDRAAPHRCRPATRDAVVDRPAAPRPRLPRRGTSEFTRYIAELTWRHRRSRCSAGRR